MNLPSGDATREAVEWLESTISVRFLKDKQALVAADVIRAWLRVAPDGNGEPPDELVNRLTIVMLADLKAVSLGMATHEKVVTEILAELYRFAGEPE
jgi:hypothetical protein